QVQKWTKRAIVSGLDGAWQEALCFVTSPSESQFQRYQERTRSACQHVVSHEKSSRSLLGGPRQSVFCDVKKNVGTLFSGKVGGQFQCVVLRVGALSCATNGSQHPLVAAEFLVEQQRATNGVEGGLGPSLRSMHLRKREPFSAGTFPLADFSGT